MGRSGVKGMQDKYLNLKKYTKFNDPPSSLFPFGLAQFGAWATFKRDPNGGTFGLVVQSKYVYINHYQMYSI